MSEKLPTRYLLRLDDLCSTWNRERWERVLALAAAHGVRPILGVLPDNRDPDLICGEVDAGFWPRVRELAAGGATIALHGYQHLAEQRGGGLLPLHEWTEFAGAPFAIQRRWITAGLAKLRGEGLQPELWIAPRHGQDRNTLRALSEAGINVVSDGFAPTPYRRGGLLWLPQQLWAPQEKGPGLWTILMHPNTATSAEICALEAFLTSHRHQFASFAEALALFPAQRYGALNFVRDWLKVRRIRMARARQQQKARPGN